MKKIGILNCSHIINFGSVLQSYATEKIVRDITGQDVYSIRYRQKKDLRYLRNYLPLLFEPEIVEFKLRGLKRKIYLTLFDRELGKKCRKRVSNFAKFVNEHFNFSKLYYGYDELRESTNEFDCYILGSDQVWHPINYGSHYYTMEWIPKDKKKIAYASSFGVNSIPKSQKEGTARYLNRIEYMSVRENAGAKIIYDLIGKTVPVVVDPTLLLDSDEWSSLCVDIPEKKYIFCYFLGNNVDAREYAIKLKNKTGLKIICIPFMDEINRIDFDFGDQQLFDVGPAEFLSYIKNADYVVTDSFHGTVFSILFEKEFVVFNRFKSGKRGSTNSRIDTLLGMFGLEERRNIFSTETIDSPIDYEKVFDQVEKVKAMSINYLEESLKINC